MNFEEFLDKVKEDETPLHIVDDGIDVRYENGLYFPEEAKSLFDRLRKEADWHRPKMPFRGKVHETRREVAWHADRHLTYEYSGQTHRWMPWTAAMMEIRKKIETRLGIRFNGVLLNLYADGSDYVSPHSDDERDLEPGAPIVAVSLGATRDFVLRHRVSKNRYVIPLESGSLLIMAGDTQKAATHTIPKRAGVMEPRISLTFRRAIQRS